MPSTVHPAPSGTSVPAAATVEAYRRGFPIDDFTTVSQWTAANGTVARDTSDVDHPSSIKITTNSGATATATRDVNLDLTGRRFISFWYRCLDANMTSLTIKLGIADRTFGPRFERGQIVGPTSAGVSGFKAIEDRWERMTVPMSALTAVGSPLPTTADLDDVRALQFTVASASSTVAEVQIADLRYHDDPLDGPGVVWMFDDGLASVYTQAFPTLAASGFVGVTSIIANSPGAGGYATLAQLQEMVAAGWETACHSSDSTQLTTLSTADLITRLRTSFDYHKTNGLPAEHFVYPGGDYNESVINATLRYFRTARSIASSGACTHETPYVAPVGRLRNLYVTASKTLSAARAELDTLADRGSVLLATFHDIVPSGATGANWNEADFEALVAYAEGLGLRSYTLSEIHPAAT